MRVLPSFFVVALIVLGQSVEAQDRGMDFYREVVRIGQDCASGKAGTEFISCFSRASPKKCESNVYQAFTQQDDALDAARRAWAFCVASCVDADLWSSNFGECKRELK